MGMKTKREYSIKQASKLTGLPDYLLRTWEARYHAVSPMRSKNNRRLYCDNNIQRLKLLKRGVENGHAISQIAKLDDSELLNLVNHVSFRLPTAAVDSESEPIDAKSFCRKSIQHAVELDGNGLQATLDGAAISLTRPALIHDVVIPLIDKTEGLLKNAKLRQVNVRMVNTILRTFLGDMLNTTVVSETAPKIVIATPFGQNDEIGALTLALSAVESGWRPLYFGPGLPAVDIAAAVASNQARAVALSTKPIEDKNEFNRELVNLWCHRHSSVGIIICGNVELATGLLAKLIGIQLTNFKNFRQTLESLTAGNPAGIGKKKKFGRAKPVRDPRHGTAAVHRLPARDRGGRRPSKPIPIGPH
jgi:DNA-binding transcriptional MerR regulator